MKQILLVLISLFQVVGVNSQPIIVYSGKNCTGESFVFDKLGDFEVPPIFKVESIRIADNSQFMVSFDFSSGCNSPETGPVKFITTTNYDLYLSFNCDRDFSRIRKIYIRPNMKNYPDKALGFLYEEPYYMGKMVMIQPGICPDIKNLGLEKVGSFQLPANSFYFFFKDINLLPYFGQANNDGKRVGYFTDNEGNLKAGQVGVNEMPFGQFQYDLPYILDRREKNMQFLEIKSIRFYQPANPKSQPLDPPYNPNVPCDLIPPNLPQPKQS